MRGSKHTLVRKLAQRAQSLVKLLITPPDLMPSQGLSYWRERVVATILLWGAALGVLVYIPSVRLAYRENLTSVVLLDTFALLFLIALLVFRRLPFWIRGGGLMLVTYVVGLELLIVLGTFGAGPVWLFAFPILSGILFGLRGSIAALLLNLFTIIGFGVLVVTGGIHWHASLNYPVDKWIVIGANFMFLNTVVTIGASVILRGLQFSLDEEKAAKELVDRKHGELIIAHNELENEVEERRRVEHELLERNRFQQSMMNAIPSPLYFMDQDGVYADCNDAFADFLGLPKNEIIGKTTHDLYPEDFADQHQEMDRLLFQNSGSQICESSVQMPDKGLKHLIHHKAVFSKNDGTLGGLIGVILDITERKRLEEQLRRSQKLEALGSLSGGIAHDFNNLLTIIIGFAEAALRHKNKHQAGQKELQTILQTAERGADLIRRILTFSRKMDTNPCAIHVNQEVERVRSLLVKTIPKMIEMELLLEKDLPSIYADPTHLEQVLINLAVNASHAMPHGGRLVFETQRVKLDEEFCKSQLGAQPGEYIQLAVSDTGHGMDRHILERIFEPFFTTKEPGEGTGLGLAMVHGIVKQNDGFIICYSEPGHGAVFKIFLPVMNSETAPEDAEIDELPVFGTETILHVDDEKLIRGLGKSALTGHGYQVLSAENGLEALETYRAAQSEISLVILDLMMPVMGGRECLNELLKIDPNVKVIVTSGFLIDAHTKAAIQDGAKGFVRKPFNMREMLKTVRRVLDEA